MRYVIVFAYFVVSAIARNFRIGTSSPIWRHCTYQFVNHENNDLCVMSCVLSAVGFQKKNGCINKRALRDFFRNGRYGKETMDAAEAQRYDDVLDKCYWGANTSPAGLKMLEEKIYKQRYKFNIPTSLAAVQDLVMEGISTVVQAIIDAFKQKPIFAIRCRRASYLILCLDLTTKIDQNKTEHGYEPPEEPNPDYRYFDPEYGLHFENTELYPKP